MVTAAIAAAAAAVVLVVAFGAARWARARADRRFETVIGRLDGHMEAISESLRQAATSSRSVLERSGDDLGLTLDLRELLERLVTRVSERTGADAAALRVRGPGDEPATISVGATIEAGRLLDEALEPPDARPFRALTLSWSYEPG